MDTDTNHNLACDKIENQAAFAEHIEIKEDKSFRKQQMQK